MEKKKTNSTFRRINNWLHLWLGLISGSIMVVVCLMACVWVFQKEITELIIPRPELEYIAPESGSVIVPSQVLALAKRMYPSDYVRSIRYERNRPISFRVDIAIPDTLKKTEQIQELIHPYTGKYLGTVKKLSPEEEKTKEKTSEFFYWALRGHRFLWLPWEIGRPIVNYSTLVFAITLITGLVWWYPKKWTKSTRDKSFKIKWSATWKRVNLNLHNVLGFYSSFLVLALAITGMFYGIQWFNKALFWSTNWGHSLPEWKEQVSDSTQVNNLLISNTFLDGKLMEIMENHNDFVRFSVFYPDTARIDGVYRIQADKFTDRYYANQSYAYDQYTGKRVAHSWPLYDKKFGDNTVGEQINRLNYDIHVGSIWGFPTKVLAFFLTFIAGSLPITGFIIWYNRKWGKKNKGKTRSTVPIRKEVNSNSVSSTHNSTVKRKPPVRFRSKTN